MRRYLALLTTLFLAIGAYAQTAVINKKWIEHNVTQNGVKGMKFHVNFDVNNMKGKNGKVIVYFEYSKGTGINDTNGRYKTVDGKVCCSDIFTPTYVNSHYSDFTIFMPLDEIHMKKGKHTYYCDVRILDISSSTAKFLTGNSYLSFTGTSGGENGGNQYNGNSGRGRNNNSEQVWREEIPSGFAINKGNPNGVRQRTTYYPCTACRGSAKCGNCFGTGICPICQGRGGMISAGYSTYIPCMSCGQSGRCCICGGTGKCVCAKHDYPGYTPRSTIVMDANGKVLYNSRGYDSDYSGGSSASGSSRGSSRGKCSSCGGTGYQRISRKYAAASASGWAQPYHNTGGNTCPYCGDVDDHYHNPCHTCRGFGHN